MTLPMSHRGETTLKDDVWPVTPSRRHATHASESDDDMRIALIADPWGRMPGWRGDARDGCGLTSDDYAMDPDVVCVSIRVRSDLEA